MSLNIIIFVVVLIIFVTIMVLIENFRTKYLPTISGKRKRKKMKYADKSEGDFDELLKLDEELLKNKDMSHGTERMLRDKEIDILTEEGKFKNWQIGDPILKNTAGIVLGENEDGTLMYNGGDDHATILASTGGGKTTTFVTPTLLLLLHSGENILGFDPKIELLKEWGLAAENLGYTVYNLNLSNMDTGGRWNPFWDAYSGYLCKNLSGHKNKKKYRDAITNVSRIETLISEIGSNENSSTDPIWQQSEKQIYGIGCILMFELLSRKNDIVNQFIDKRQYILDNDEIVWNNMVLKKGDRIESVLQMIIDNKSRSEIDHHVKMCLNFATFFNIIRYISTRDEAKIPKIKEIIENDDILSDYEHILYIKSEILLDSAEATYQSMMATPKAKLSSFSDDVVVDLLSGYPGLPGYIDLPTIVAGEKNLILCNVREDDRTFSYIAQMLLTSLYSALKTEADLNKSGKLNTRFHFLLEEFGNMPKIEGLPGMLTLSRGIGIRFYLVIQSFDQLALVYGAETEKIIKSNTMLLALPINDIDTAKVLSEILGKATIEDITIDEEIENKGGTVMGSTELKTTTRSQNIARDLRTPDELLIIQMGEAYIKKQQLRPIRTRMPVIFKNEKLMALSKGTMELVFRDIEKNTLRPEDFDYLLIRKDPRAFTRKLEKSKAYKIEITY